MQKVSNFNDFLGEASLRGNIGVPGEEGSGRESWLDKITRSSDANARAFAQQNRNDIQNFMGLVMRAQSLQRGKEEALSELAEKGIREVFGSLLDDVTLDLKIVNPNEVGEMLRPTPTDDDAQEMPELEEMTDQRLIDEVQKRKILRTIQQGKGLNTKAILNLSIFKDGIDEIFGADAPEYMRTLNKIANIAQFFDWDVPEELRAQMVQSRTGFSGASSLEFGDDEDEDLEKKQKSAEEILADLENGEDIPNNDAAEELLDGVDVTVKAVGVDLSVLIHEAVKGIYMLVTQYSLEALTEEDAERVIANTDTLMDELQEFKFGRQMERALFKPVSENEGVKAAIENMLRYDASDVEITAFQEQVQFLFFGKIVTIGNEDPVKMLEIVNEILSESDAVGELCDPLIDEVLEDLAAESEYQRYAARPEDSEKDMGGSDAEDSDDIIPRIEAPEEAQMSRDEITDAIIDAYERGDMEAVRRLESMLKESVEVSDFTAFINALKGLQ